MDKRTAIEYVVKDLNAVIFHLENPDGPCPQCSVALRRATIEVMKIRAGEYSDAK